MTALEYLKRNIDINYIPYPSTHFNLLSSDYTNPEAIRTIPNCNGIYILGKRKFAMITDYMCDGAIYRSQYGKGINSNTYYLLKPLNPNFSKLGKWINDNLFKNMINEVETTSVLTELVKLRIAINLIYTAPFLSITDKMQWSEWIKELYWSRKAVLNKWYIEEVLPF